MDYKKTLNLPKTAFPMKANLAKREPEQLKIWEENRLHEKINESPLCHSALDAESYPIDSCFPARRQAWRRNNNLSGNK